MRGAGAVTFCDSAAGARQATYQPQPRDEPPRPSYWATTTSESARSALRSNAAATNPPSNTANAPTN